MSTTPSSTHRLVSFLGQGGNGVVYLAIAHGPEGVDKLVVLKALKGAVDSKLREQLMNEARVSVLLNHPNVVQTFGVTVQDGRPVISMEFLDGQPLSKLLERAWQEPGTVSLSVWLRIVRDMLRGLHHAHELSSLDGTHLGLVHRDVTPQNVFVTFGGGVKILDFGIAKTATSLLSTAPGIVKGSLRYMSPEQVQLRTLDRRSDIFSVGVILWEMLVGERLWRRSTETSVMQALRGTEEVRSPQAVNPAVPAELARIVLKALALQREERYRSCAELQADLEAHGELACDDELARVFGQLLRDARLDVQTLLARELLHSRALSLPEPLAGARTPSARPDYEDPQEWPGGGERGQYTARVDRELKRHTPSSNVPRVALGFAKEASLAPLTAVGPTETGNAAEGRRTWLGFAAFGLLLCWVVGSTLHSRLAAPTAQGVLVAQASAANSVELAPRAALPQVVAEVAVSQALSPNVARSAAAIRAAKAQRGRSSAPSASNAIIASEDPPPSVADFGGRR